ncbi:MAG: AAA family ATPase, partial [Acidobacteria bacterium]|nr:AAA family ATPase [Acidobacteriota bacterium]
AITLTEELLRTGGLAVVGGPAYIASLTEGIPRSTNAEHYARIVKDRALRRQVIRLAKNLSNGAADIGTDPTALLSTLEQGQRNLSAALRDGVAAERKLPFRTAAQIAVETPASIECICRPWVAAGAITEVDGKIKAAGKTTWMLAMCRAVLDGLAFMGEPTTKGPVVYLTEQPPQSFRVALERAGLLGRDDFIVLYWHEVARLPWEVIVREAVMECRRRGASLLVVDTLGRFTGIEGDAENNAGDALKAMKPLQLAAADGLGILTGRHERKSGGEVSDSARGSTAFGGAVDTILTMRRPEGQVRPTVRIIRAISRFSEVPVELAIELTPGGYVALDSTEGLAVQEASALILKAAPKREAGAIDLKALCKKSGVKRTTGQEAVEQLQMAGNLKSVGTGKKGDPFRYYAATREDSAGTTPPIAAETNAQPVAPSAGANDRNRWAEIEF